VSDNKYGKCALYPIVGKTEENNMNFLVTGVKDIEITDYIYCTTARKFSHMCGTEGRLYENKNL
jgi:hypothetical protein